MIQNWVKAFRVFAILAVVYFSAVGQSARAEIPGGFEGAVLDEVRKGHVYPKVDRDGTKDYFMTMRALVKRTTADQYVKLISGTDEFKHFVPDLILDSTPSELSDAAKGTYTYQMDVQVHYGPIPVTLYATVERKIEKIQGDTVITYSYTFKDFENWMEPLIETTRLIQDPAHPDDGIYLIDTIDIKLKKAPPNSKAMKEELAQTFFKLIAAFKEKLDGERAVHPLEIK